MESWKPQEDSVEREGWSIKSSDCVTEVEEDEDKKGHVTKQEDFLIWDMAVSVEQHWWN